MIPILATKKCTLAVLVCGASLLTLPARAQTDTPPPPPPDQMQGPPPGYNGPRRGGPDQRAEMLARHLNLTPDQTTQVKALMETEHSRMEALHANSSLSREDMHAQMMAIHQDSETKLRALLTPDQVTKYDAMEAQRRQRMQEHGDGAPPPPPPPEGAPQL